MKLMTLMAALLSSALLTVPTVTEIGDTRIAELGRAVATARA